MIMGTTWIHFILIVALIFIEVSYVQSGEISCDEKKLIVDSHNNFRQLVATGQLPGQPKAANMQKIAWDDNLAKTAQAWADKKIDTNNPDSGFLGENIYKSSPSDSGNVFDWSIPIKKWLGESLTYSYCSIGECVSTGTGAYTQIVWATTKYVGCGASVMKDENGVDFKFYVCNYTPAGNYVSESPYKIGGGCETLCCSEQCNGLYGAQC